ncbi:MAG: FIST C-terminal domain-containing protein [Chitinispirillaceae bacterium]|nr:FIST C-terminal domain-containing protein [Chitinispirillaceae bacterium]
MRVKFRKGATTERAPEKAIEEMAEQIGMPDATVTALFLSSHYDLDSIRRQIKKKISGPLICCTTSGEITDNGYQNSSICGFSLSGDAVSVSTFPITCIRNPDPHSVQQTIGQIKNVIQHDREFHPERNFFGVLLIDGLSVREEQIAATFGNALSDIPVIGGSAGDDLQFNRCSILINGEFMSEAALFCLFSTALPFSIVKSQHFSATDTRLVITKARPNERIVEEINGVPAALEYSRITGVPSDELGPASFSRYPLILRHSGDIHVRSIQKINADESLTFFCAIDEGVVLRVARRQDMCEALEKSLTQAETSVGKILFTLGFDCILRRLESREFSFDERIRNIFRRFNTVGFCTYGEQSNSLHVNQTFSGVVMGDLSGE